MDKNTSGRGRVLVHPDKKKDTRNRSESTRSCLTASSKPLTTNKTNHAYKTKLSIRTHPTSNGCCMHV